MLHLSKLWAGQVFFSSLVLFFTLYIQIPPLKHVLVELIVVMVKVKTGHLHFEPISTKGLKAFARLAGVSVFKS